MELEWSDEIPFTTKNIKESVPTKAGVYQILQSDEYPRYEGKTRIVKIGQSATSLQEEILNHQARHTAANRLARIRKRALLHVSVRYAVISEKEARVAESALLRQFEDEHWDLPVLNSTRGYGRDDDKHFRG